MTTSKTATLPATKRSSHGKGPARALRREGKIPAVIYNKKQEPISIAMPLKEITLEYARGRFRSRLININVEGGETIQALPKEMQFHPVTDAIEHVDFLKVEAGSEITVKVPLRIVGRQRSVGVKRGGALNIVRHEIEFICKPDSIPAFIEADIINLDIGESLHIEDVNVPEGVRPVIARNFTLLTIAGRGGKADAADEAAEAASAAESAEAADGAEGAPAADGAEGAPAAEADKK